jgi:hypothetical protein
MTCAGSIRTQASRIGDVDAAMNRTLLRRGTLPAALAALLAAATVAWAEPARTADMNAAAAIFEWDSEAITGTPLENVTTDDTLVKLSEAGGTLNVVLSEPDDGAIDVDLELYKSDAAGEPQGDPVASAATGSSEESISAKNLKAGTYLIRIFGFASVEGHVHGKATFRSAAPVEPDPATSAPPPLAGGGGSDATPQAAFAKLAKSAKAKKLKGFKGTASDDKAVAKVEVAVVRKKGKKCYVMTSKGSFAKLAKCTDPTIFHGASGTTAWSYKLPKALPKGTYTAFVRAVDSAGQTQAGYTQANKKAFKIK